jgi:hypothetical protein
MQYTHKHNRILLLLGIFFISFQTPAAENEVTLLKNNKVFYPQNQKLYDLYPWSILYYYGISSSDPLFRMVAGDFHRWPEHIQSLELEYTLSEQNSVRRFFNPLVGIVQVAGNLTVRKGSQQQTIYEFDPYIAFRWANFPWNHYVNTSFALGEGISYATSIPALESKYGNKNAKRLLNYMLIEATFASPSYPRLQLVTRIHHRSGAFGLYHAGNTGSNDVGLGIRYLFD